MFRIGIISIATCATSLAIDLIDVGAVEVINSYFTVNIIT
jgi:hypothetical protein